MTSASTPAPKITIRLLFLQHFDDFFDVEKNPALSFESTSGVTGMKGNRGKLAGNLTIHGVTKPVVFDVVFRGQGKDPWDNVRAGFSASLNINRKDYGLNWNQMLETGGVLVGEEVEIRIDVEGIEVESPGSVVLPVSRFGTLLRESTDEKLRLEARLKTLK